MKKSAIHAATLLCLMVLLPLFLQSAAEAAPGDYLLQWGARYHFNNPVTLAQDKEGKIYLSDWGVDAPPISVHPNIYVFNPAGEQLRRWGSYGSQDGQIMAPGKMAFDQDNNLYFCDSVLDRIEVFDGAGNFIRKWGRPGTGDGEFSQPSDVVIDGSGNVYVADYSNHRIQVFDRTGRFLRKWGTQGSGDGQLNYPFRLALDGSGRIYVDEYGNQRVQVFDASGNFIRKWGGPGQGDGQFTGPTAIAIDGKGEVYVSDYSDRVQVFDSNGTFLRKWGGTGTGDGLFMQPLGILAGANGEIYVTDARNDRVQIFDAAGNFIGKWASHGSGDGEFEEPYQAAIDANGDVYVADMLNRRVQVSSSTGTFLRKWTVQTMPKGIALDGKGNVFVAGTWGNTIHVYDTTGNLLREWEARVPQAMAVDPAGNLWVIAFADSSMNDLQIRTYDSAGNLVRTWGTQMGLGYPRGIAIDGTGKVYVADSISNRVNVYDSDGNFLGCFGEGMFTFPAGVAVDTRGHVYVDDRDGNAIYVFDNNGTLRGKWGGFGDGNGKIFSPSGIAVDASGARVVVSDTGNSRMQVFEGYGSGEVTTAWSGQDIGSVGVAGRDSYINGSFTVQASGADIWGTADAFRYVFRPLIGDGEIIARVASVQNTNGYAKGGVMIRETLSANSAHAMMDLTPAKGAEFSRRYATGGRTIVSAAAWAEPPYWVKLVRKGNTFSGYLARDGINWEPVGSNVIGMRSSVYVGLAATSHNNQILGATVFDSVSLAGQTSTPTVAIVTPAAGTSFTAPATLEISAKAAAGQGATVRQVEFYAGTTLLGTAASAPYRVTWSSVGAGSYRLTAKVIDSQGATETSAPVEITVSGTLPAPWSSQDIGSVGVAGTTTYAGGVFTLKGSGADIWGTADSFRFVYKEMTGDGQIVARVVSLQNTNSYAKGGVMIRQSLAPDSVHAMVNLRPSGGVEFSRRTTAGGSTSAPTWGGIVPPYWVKLVRSGNTFTGSMSPDGVSWTQVGSATIDMTGSVYVGLVVNSHNNSVLCTTTIDHVQ